MVYYLIYKYYLFLSSFSLTTYHFKTFFANENYYTITKVEQAFTMEWFTQISVPIVSFNEIYMDKIHDDTYAIVSD